MKRYIRSDTDADIKTKVLKMLKDKNIDTSTCQYEFLATNYETGHPKKVKFSCPGDYLAYFAMAIAKAPTIQNLVYHYYDEEGLIDELNDMLEDCPNVKSLKKYARDVWTDDTSSWYFKYLKNLTTGEYLYGSEPDESYEESEEW